MDKDGEKGVSYDMDKFSIWHDVEKRDLCFLIVRSALVYNLHKLQRFMLAGCVG